MYLLHKLRQLGSVVRELISTDKLVLSLHMVWNGSDELQTGRLKVQMRPEARYLKRSVHIVGC